MTQQSATADEQEEAFYPPESTITQRKLRLTLAQLSPDVLPGTIENRVFVGGNYDLAPVLRRIKYYVGQTGHTPIFVGDFRIPTNKINEYSLRLLNQCRKAIFDVTVDSGYLMEIQEALSKSYISPLLVYMCYDAARRMPSTASSMVKTLELPSEKKQGYMTFPELRRIVNKFLVPRLV